MGTCHGRSFGCLRCSSHDISETSSLRKRLDDPKYLFWVKSTLCLQYFKEGLESFTEEKSQKLHDKVLQAVQQCDNISIKGLCANGDIEFNKVKKKWEVKNCSCQNCLKDIPKLQDLVVRTGRQFKDVKMQALHDKVLKELQNYNNPTINGTCSGASVKSNKIRNCICQKCEVYIDTLKKNQEPPFTFRQSNFDNSDIEKWHTEHWQLAKLFMNQGQKKQSISPQETDISGLCNFIIHSIVPGACIQTIQYLKDVRDGRNTMIHTANMEVTKSEFLSLTTAMIDLLSDPKELARRNDTKTAVENIEKVRKASFNITLECESDVLKIRGGEICQLDKDLRTDIVELRETVCNSKQSTEEDLKLLRNQLQRREDEMKKVDGMLQIWTQKIEKNEISRDILNTEMKVISSSVDETRNDLKAVHNDFDCLKTEVKRIAAEVDDIKLNIKPKNTDTITMEGKKKSLNDEVEEDKKYQMLRADGLCCPKPRPVSEKTDYKQLTVYVKIYAYLKEEMEIAHAKSIALQLLERDLIDRIIDSRARRRVVHILLKKVLKDHCRYLKKFMDLLTEGKELGCMLEQKIEAALPEEHEIEGVMNSTGSIGQWQLEERDREYLVDHIKDFCTIDRLNDHFLSKLYFSIRVHDSVCDLISNSDDVCTKGALRLLEKMQMCSVTIVDEFCKVMEEYERPFIETDLRQKYLCERNVQSALPDSVDPMDDEELFRLFKIQRGDFETYMKDIYRSKVVDAKCGSLILIVRPESEQLFWAKLKKDCLEGNIDGILNAAFSDKNFPNVYDLRFTIYSKKDEDGLPVAVFKFEYITGEHVPTKGDVLSGKDPIKRHHDLFCEELHVQEDLIAALIKDHFLDKDFRANLEKESLRRSKVSCLLDNILSSEKGYSKIKEYTKSTNPYLYEKLEDADTEELDADTIHSELVFQCEAHINAEVTDVWKPQVSSIPKKSWIITKKICHFQEQDLSTLDVEDVERVMETEKELAEAEDVERKMETEKDVEREMETEKELAKDISTLEAEDVERKMETEKASYPARCLATVELPDSDLLNQYTPLSLRLYDVLECIGASDEQRHHWRRKTVYVEAALTAYYQPTMTFCVFGSQREGTTTIGMDSAYDMVGIHNDIKVVRNISEAPSGDCVLLVQDNSTPPGYCKLQLVHNGVPLKRGDQSWLDKHNYGIDLISCADKKNRLVCYYDHSAIPQGPAQRKGYNDFVHALRCYSWPDCATEWLNRKRDHNCPSSDLTETCKSLGFLLVPVGHPHSDEQALQWRISFSHQERLLVDRFTSVQLKCYRLLKYIKKEILPKLMQETITSYHCKTCVFYMIQNSSMDFWSPENLVCCVIACLRMFLRWAENGNCPNYFIPSENMFEKNVYGEIWEQLCDALQKILSSDYEQILHQIKCDSVGELMHYYQVKEGENIFQDKQAEIQILDLELLTNITTDGLYARNRILAKHYNRNLKVCTENLTSQQRTIRETVSQQRDTETQAAWCFTLPFTQVSLLSNSVALDIQEQRSKEEILKALTCNRWQELHLKLDSSELKQASLMYMLGYYSDSIDNLTSLKHHGRFSVCNCRKPQTVPRPKDILEATGGRSDFTPEELLSDLLSPCVVFLPTESTVTPIAIRYEMIRSVGMPPGSRDNGNNGNWYDWGVVDGRFLRHFLLYLNHIKLGLYSDATEDISNMELMVTTRDISHKETCHNLLGWVYKENRLVEKAINCFQQSLEIQPIHNAAVWQLCFLMRDIYTEKKYQPNEASH